MTLSPALLPALAMTPTEGGANAMPLLLFQLLAMGLVFYFLVIRPQGQARKRHGELLAALKKGDEVMTSGGLIGRVKDIKEVKDTNEVRVTVETGTSTVVVERSRIVRVGNVSAPEAGR